MEITLALLKLITMSLKCTLIWFHELSKIIFYSSVRFCHCPLHCENSNELGHRNTAQTDQLNPLFHTFANLVNRDGMQQNIDWLVSSSLFSPTEGNKNCHPHFRNRGPKHIFGRGKR